MVTDSVDMGEAAFRAFTNTIEGTFFRDGRLWAEATPRVYGYNIERKVLHDGGVPASELRSAQLVTQLVSRIVKELYMVDADFGAITLSCQREQLANTFRIRVRDSVTPDEPVIAIIAVSLGAAKVVYALQDKKGNWSRFRGQPIRGQQWLVRGIRRGLQYIAGDRVAEVMPSLRELAVVSQAKATHAGVLTPA